MYCMPVVLLVLSAGSLIAQPVVCATSATPPIVRAEGLTERIGDLLLTCTGTPGNMFSANVKISLNTDLTNRLSSSSPGPTVVGIVFTVDSGSGPQPVLTPPILAGPSSITYLGVPITFSSNGGVNLDISGIRANANVLPVGLPIVASVSINNAGLALTNAQLTAGTSNRGLYASYTATFICAQSGSPVPATFDFNDLVSAGTVFETVRVTEGFGDAFQPLFGFQNFNADSGERILVQYTGFPQDSLLYVPDVVAGSDAVQPTSAGDFNLPVSGGTYAPAAGGSLLLARVNNAGANGAGGTPVYQPGSIGSGNVMFSTASQLPIATDGSAYVVYEVVDANPSAIESATIPTFLALSPDPNRQPSATTEEIFFAPSSNVGVATATDPLPRFVPEIAQPDCAIVGGCDVTPPMLSVTPGSLGFTIQSGVVEQSSSVAIANSGGGAMLWQAFVTYAAGSAGGGGLQWLSISSIKGIGNATLIAIAIPRTLAPGVYTATLNIDAGPVAGSIAIPVTLTVTAPPPPPGPTITSVLNAASFAPVPVVPGSISTVMGAGFSGAAVSATFNNIAAGILFTNAGQINLLVPAQLAGLTAAQLVVTVDGRSSTPVSVMVAPFEPAIFNGGIVNQDGTINSSNSPAALGSVIAMWGTGLSGNGTITANIGGQDIAVPYYAGPAPGLPGVQQVNLIVPTNLAPGTTQVYVCGTVSGGSPVCSIPAPLTVN